MSGIIVESRVEADALVAGAAGAYGIGGVHICALLYEHLSDG